MKVGFIGDIHANLDALNQCLEILVKQEKCDYVMTTGDIVGYGPQPRECIERLIKLEIPSVRGNHDEYALQDTPLNNINQYARHVMEWTRNQLDDHHKKYLQSLPDIIDAKEFSVTHASNSLTPRWTYVISESTAAVNFAHQKHRICFNGHTHLPMIFSQDPNGQVNMQTLSSGPLDKDLKYLINVGSIGQPRDSVPESSVVVFDTEEYNIKALRVEYDIKKTQELMREQGFPEPLITRLSFGR